MFATPSAPRKKSSDAAESSGISADPWSSPDCPPSLPFLDSRDHFSLSSYSSQPSFSSSESVGLDGLGADDYQLQEALLVFFLQLFGDPRPFQVSRAGASSSKGAFSSSSSSAPQGVGSTTSLDAVRSAYLTSRSKANDRPGERKLTRRESELRCYRFMSTPVALVVIWIRTSPPVLYFMFVFKSSSYRFVYP